MHAQPSMLVLVSLEDDPEKTSNGVTRSDMKERKASKDLANDRNTWKSFLRTIQPIQAWKIGVKNMMMTMIKQKHFKVSSTKLKHIRASKMNMLK